MAKTNYKEISVGSANGVTWYLKLVLTEHAYSVKDNTSTVIRQLYLRAANTAYSISFDNRSAWIGDNKQTIAYTQSGKEHLLFEDYVIVEHNSDGTGSYSTGFGISTSFALNGSSTCSLPLTIIPRATTPVLSSEEYEMGTTISITLDRAVSTFTHKLYYKVGNSAKILFASDVETSFNWTDNLYLINWIDTSDRGTVTIYCGTYNGDTYIGEKSTTFIGTVPTNVVPKINSITISEATEGIASKFGAYVKDKSTLQVSINASGDYGSSIKSYKTTIDGITYIDSNFKSEILKNSGTVTLTTTVTDTRDRTAVKTQSINVLDYYSPKILDFLVQRCDSSGKVADDDTAKYLLATFGYDIAPVNNKNDKKAVLQYYDSKNNSWNDITTITSVYKREISNYKSTIVFNVDESYEIRLVLTDFFNKDESAVIISREIEPTYTLINFHSTGNGMAVGTVATEEDAFDIGLEKTIVRGDLLLGDSKVNIKKMIIDMAYPVGSYYETSNTNFNPNTSWYGTWVLEQDGTVLVSKSNTSGSKFNSALGTILGEEEHKLTKAELPKIDIATQWAHPSTSGGNGAGLQYGQNAGTSENVLTYNVNFGDLPHNNIQPSKIVNRWHRTA